MHDFNCRNAGEMRVPEIADGTRFLKDTEKGREEMCDVMQGLMDENTEKVTIRMIKNLHETSGKSYDEIMTGMMLSVEEKEKYSELLSKNSGS